MEELQAKREMEGKDASQAGRGGDLAVGVADEDETSRMPEWVKSILGAEERKRRPEDQTQKQRIHRVPKKLRNTEEYFKRCYEPNVVAIGPYHDRYKHELEQVEKLKPTIAKQFFGSIKDDRKKKSAVINSLEAIKKLGNLYDEDSTKDIDEGELVRMMFLDGCFILQFIYCIVHYQVEELGMKNYHINLARQDLFLLENQLPFQVLEVLMRIHEGGFEDLMCMLVDFIYLTTIFTPFSWEVYFLIEDVQPIHLLDLLRTLLLGIAGKKNERSIPIDSCTGLPFHVPIYGRRRHTQRCIKGRMFRRAKELKAAGIHLKPARSTGSLRGINFRSYCIYGKLTLPQITINSSTKTMFLNLIAHEECMDDPHEFGFTSYICFLDALIDHAEDVKELRSAGILDNLLGSDEDVATLFNKIADDLVPEVDTYKDVKVQIRDYFQNRPKMKLASWVAEVLRDHFRSPWTAIAVFTAVFVICLTAVQTYFTIFPRAD